jgi:hypothetical protein
MRLIKLKTPQPEQKVTHGFGFYKGARLFFFAKNHPLDLWDPWIDRGRRGKA